MENHLVHFTLENVLTNSSVGLYRDLLRKGLVNVECLTIPMDLLYPSDLIEVVVHLLCFFTFINDSDKQCFAGKVPLQTGGWYSDLEWIVTVIVRSGPNLQELLEGIKSTCIFGDLDDNLHTRFKRKPPNAQIHHDPTVGEGFLTATGHVPPESKTFGLWLPHGLSKDERERFDQVELVIERAPGIRNSYSKVLGVSITIFIAVLGHADEDEDALTGIEE